MGKVGGGGHILKSLLVLLPNTITNLVVQNQNC